jgi:hypothetical protein
VIGLVLSAYFQPLWVWSGIVALMFGAMLFGRPEKMLAGYFIWASVEPFMHQILPGIFDYVDEILLVGTMAVLIGIRTLRGRFSFSNKAFMALFKLLLLTGLVSSLYSGAPIVSVVNCFISYFTFPFVLFLAYECRTEKVVRFVFKFAVIYFFIQIILNIGWIAGVNPLPNIHARARNYSDMCHGTLDSAQWLGYVFIWLFFLFVTVARHMPKGSRRGVYYILALAAFIQFQFTFTNHAYLYLLICAAVYMALLSKTLFSLLKVVPAIFICILIAFLVGQGVKSNVYTVEQSDNLSTIYSASNLKYRYDRFLHAPKMQLINRVTVNWLRTSPQKWLVGLGVGNGTSAIGMSRISPGAYELLADYYLTQTGRNERVGNSILESTTSGLVSLWSEVGMLGFVFYHWMCVLVYIRVWRNLRKGLYTSLYQQILAEAFIPAIVLYVLAAFLADPYYLDAWVVTMWAWAGLVFDPIAGEASLNEGKASGCRGDVSVSGRS